ncbi:hypothetical protein B0T25DRAFT_574359 [Lasiosphaeria hispida]|uniref:PD-(D/E)XK nuclease-like domain-containing protein n=1 Tax=Lasiosphaeria hispida TaxID=260671 RepID=A0AAJ0H7J2_9PEZI|nr:hypothetical protein B0T25DRAFT_574359 [Lasiosphaeria hispida]
MATVFCPFGRLPGEIRDIIWDCAILSIEPGVYIFTIQCGPLKATNSVLRKSVVFRLRKHTRSKAAGRYPLAILLPYSLRAGDKNPRRKQRTRQQEPPRIWIYGCYGLRNIALEFDPEWDLVQQPGTVLSLIARETTEPGDGGKLEAVWLVDYTLKCANHVPIDRSTRAIFHGSYCRFVQVLPEEANGCDTPWLRGSGAIGSFDFVAAFDQHCENHVRRAEEEARQHTGNPRRLVMEVKYGVLACDVSTQHLPISPSGEGLLDSTMELTDEDSHQLRHRAKLPRRDLSARGRGRISKKPTSRNRSPTKPSTITELEHANIPITQTDITRLSTQDLPEDARHLWQEASRIAARSKFMPPWIQHRSGSQLSIEPIFDHYLSGVYPFDQDDARATLELALVDRILQETVACQLDSEGEVVWNEAVHSRVLEAALLPFAGQVKYRNVTTADIHPDYLLPLIPHGPDSASTITSKSGTCTPTQSVGTSGGGSQLAAQARRVDYALVLADAETEAAARELLRDMNMSGWASCQSINHSEQTFLCHRPISISVETKADGTERDAKLQLSIWVAAHILRLRSLVAMWDDESASAVDKPKTMPVSVVLPLLLVSGPRWTLYLARDLGNSIEIIHIGEVGTSATFVGCYQLIAMIRVLAGWMINVYRPWFHTYVLSGRHQAGESAAESPAAG